MHRKHRISKPKQYNVQVTKQVTLLSCRSDLERPREVKLCVSLVLRCIYETDNVSSQL